LLLKIFMKLIYRHMCLDQNLQSISLGASQPGAQPGMNNPQQMNPMINQQNGQNNMYQNNLNQGLICRNALGQDLTLTKDSCKWFFF
jgi:hypothetical protein